MAQPGYEGEMMTREDLQVLYDNLGNMRNLAKHLGMSTADITPYLRQHGVVTRKRGGDWKRMPGARVAGKIEANRAGNALQGDPAFRARPVQREYCQEQRRPCVLSGEGHCQACKAEHDLSAYSGAGASSSWIDPSQGGRGKRCGAFVRDRV